MAAWQFCYDTTFAGSVFSLRLGVKDPMPKSEIAGKRIQSLNRLYHQKADRTFANVTESSGEGLGSHGLAAADYDHDRLRILRCWSGGNYLIATTDMVIQDIIRRRHLAACCPPAPLIGLRPDGRWTFLVRLLNGFPRRVCLLRTIRQVYRLLPTIQFQGPYKLALSPAPDGSLKCKRQAGIAEAGEG